MKDKPQIKIFIFPIIMIALLTAVDQLTKKIITGSFALYDSKPVIPKIFSITYIRNTGTAFGMFKGKRIIFLILTIIVLFMCFYIYSNISTQNKFKPLRIAMIFLISGAIGNMIDRVKLGYVIDFLYFELIDFPIFNVADIYVTCSMIFIFLLLIFKYNNDDFDIILGSKN